MKAFLFSNNYNYFCTYERFNAAESRDQACLVYAEASKRSNEIQQSNTSWRTTS